MQSTMSQDSVNNGRPSCKTMLPTWSDAIVAIGELYCLMAMTARHNVRLTFYVKIVMLGRGINLPRQGVTCRRVYYGTSCIDLVFWPGVQC